MEVPASAIVRTTFKPLRGGRYRCNQTGHVTRNPKAYRQSVVRAAQNKGGKRKQTSSPAIATAVQPPAPTMREARWNMAFWSAQCPHPGCFLTNYSVYGRGVHSCHHCDQQFKVV